MHSETRRILDVIEGALIRGHNTPNSVEREVATELWNILSALRGPDLPDLGGTAKEATVYVRRAAFPRLAMLIESGNTATPSIWRSGKFANLPTFAHKLPAGSYTGNTSGGPHFIDHIEAAYRVVNSK